MTKANPYDLKKIVNDEKYAKDNHFKVKKSGELFLIKYIKNHINSENISSFGRFRSVITDGKNIISMAPQKSYKFEDFKLKNKKSDCILQEFIEGTMINCFYIRLYDVYVSNVLSLRTPWKHISFVFVIFAHVPQSN